MDILHTAICLYGLRVGFIIDTIDMLDGRCCLDGAP